MKKQLPSAFSFPLPFSLVFLQVLPSEYWVLPSEYWVVLPVHVERKVLVCRKWQHVTEVKETLWDGPQPKKSGKHLRILRKIRHKTHRGWWRRVLEFSVGDFLSRMFFPYTLTLNSMFVVYEFVFPHSGNRSLGKKSKHHTVCKHHVIS